MKRFLWLCAFYAVVWLHLALVGMVSLSFVLLPILQPWYVALPVCIFITDLVFSKRECKITTLENYIRKKLGMKTIGGFLGHYIYKPLFRKKKIATDVNMQAVQFQLESSN